MTKHSTLRLPADLSDFVRKSGAKEGRNYSEQVRYMLEIAKNIISDENIDKEILDRTIQRNLYINYSIFEMVKNLLGDKYDSKKIHEAVTQRLAKFETDALKDIDEKRKELNEK